MCIGEDNGVWKGETFSYQERVYNGGRRDVVGLGLYLHCRGDKFTLGKKLYYGVQWQRTVLRKWRHFHTGREFIMGWTRWGEVIIRIMAQPRQGRLLHGGDSVTVTTADF